MRRLKAPRYHAVGLMEMLWNFTAKECPTGLLENRTADDIAVATGWDGDENVLVEALVYARFLEVHGESWRVHDWPDHCDNSVHLKLWRDRRCFADGRPPKVASTSLNSKEREEYEKWFHGAAMTFHGIPVGPSQAMPSQAMPSRAVSGHGAPTAQTRAPRGPDFEDFSANDRGPAVSQLASDLMDAHPVKGKLVGAESALAAVLMRDADFEATCVRIRASHAAWRPEFNKRIDAGKHVPLLDRWVLDGDWKHPPAAALPRAPSRSVICDSCGCWPCLDGCEKSPLTKKGAG